MSVSGVFAARWSRALAYAERRLPALTRLKLPEALPIGLHRRRIYVVPTRFGLAYSLVLLVMLLGALNYNNNPAIMLTCLIAAAGYQSVFQSFRTLHGVRLCALRAETCHAGTMLHLTLAFDGAGRARQGLKLALEGIETVFDLVPGGDGRVQLEVPAPQRGWRTFGRLRLWTEYPFGLFYVWSWLNPQFGALVYPGLEANAPALPVSGGDAETFSQRRSGDEFASLRNYHPTDPKRSVAWKASARHDTLLVKEFEQRRGRETLLDFSALDGLDYEARIARLARWVTMAESAQVRYALKLPDKYLPAGLGAEQRHTCLRELALMPGMPA